MNTYSLCNFLLNFTDIDIFMITDMTNKIQK